MNKEQLQELRNQIVLGSVYLGDYENNMCVSADRCCTFFEGYLEYLEELEDSSESIDKLYDWHLIAGLEEDLMSEKQIREYIAMKEHIQVITTREDLIFHRDAEEELWRVKTFMGVLFYDDEELAEMLFEENEVITMQ